MLIKEKSFGFFTTAASIFENLFKKVLLFDVSSDCHSFLGSRRKVENPKSKGLLYANFNENLKIFLTTISAKEFVLRF